MPVHTPINLKHITRREWAYYKKPCTRPECTGKFFLIYNDMTCHACGHQVPRPNDESRQPKPRKDYKRTSKMLSTGAVRFNVLTLKGDDFRLTQKQIQLIYLNDNNEKAVLPIGKPI